MKELMLALICDFAVTLLLSDESQYEGGEFYLFKPTDLKTLNHNSTPDERAEVINNIKNLPIINQKRGDVIIYKGSSHWHGILPVSSGSRHAIIFFFNTKPLFPVQSLLDSNTLGS
jgi:predicted 2-oxoglutarate/Fe(II)-dependent dioxygenase YbiX